MEDRGDIAKDGEKSHGQVDSGPPSFLVPAGTRFVRCSMITFAAAAVVLFHFLTVQLSTQKTT